MLLFLFLALLSVFLAMLASKRRRTLKARAFYQQEMHEIKRDLDVLLKRPNLTFTEREQIAFLRNRLAFAKQHPPDKYIV